MARIGLEKSAWLILSILGVMGCYPSQQKGPNLERDDLPNIVFILADDMGYGDIQAFNPDSEIPTPNLNRLAQEGMCFTDAHSGSAVCSPTRYGLLTGRYCWRTRLKNGVLWPPDDEPLIGPDRLTVAGLLKQKGYRTACFGKWHLGMEWSRDARGNVDFNRPIQYGPTDVGFDEFFGIAGSLDMVPYVFYHNREASAAVTQIQEGLTFPRFIREGPRAADFDAQQVLDRLTEKAVDFIERSAKTAQPFFLYFPLTAPHKPVWPARRFERTTEEGPYGDFIHQTDWTVGRVMETLDRTGVAEQTLVFFSSDNGSYMYRIPEGSPDHVVEPGVQGFHTDRHRSNWIWRGTKADIWEGGHRVPFITRWLGKVKQGSQSSQTICLTDFMATCAEIMNTKLPETAAEDSFSFLAVIFGADRGTIRAPVIHHSGNGTFALREGRWKMVFANGSGGRQKPVGKPFEKPFFLFDLENDPAETTNVIERFPDIAERLWRRLEAIRTSGRSR